MSHDHDEENAANHLHWYRFDYECTFYHLSWSTMRLYAAWRSCPKSYFQFNVLKRGLGTRIPLRPPLVVSGPLLGCQSLRNNRSNSEWLIERQLLGKFLAFVLLWRNQFQYLCWSQQLFFRGNTDVVSPFPQSHCATVPGNLRLPSRKKAWKALDSCWIHAFVSLILITPQLCQAQRYSYTVYHCIHKDACIYVYTYYIYTYTHTAFLEPICPYFGLKMLQPFQKRVLSSGSRHHAQFFLNEYINI